MATATLKQLKLRAMQPHAHAVGLMVKQLQDGATHKEIKDVTGLHPTTIKRYISAMRKARAIYIASWELDSIGRAVLPVLMIGDKPDAKRTTLTHAERGQRYRARKKQKEFIAATAGRAPIPTRHAKDVQEVQRL